MVWSASRFWGNLDGIGILGFILRALILYLALLLFTRLMGKRQIAQLRFFDFVIAITIGEVVAPPLSDSRSSLIAALVSIATLAAAHIVISYISLKSEPIRNALNGVPMVMVQNGKIVEENLSTARFTIDDLMSKLRVHGVPNIADVEFAILENSGEVSVIKKSQFEALTPNHMGMPTMYKGLPSVLIKDGEIEYAHLEDVNLTLEWLMQQLQKQGINDPKDVLLASLDTNGNLYIDKKTIS